MVFRYTRPAEMIRGTPNQIRSYKRAEYRKHREAYIRRSAVYKKTRAGRRSDRAWRLKKRYKLAIGEWERRYRDQRGLCAICLERAAKHTDHSHYTGAVRGLLCLNCNIGLGGFRDNLNFLARAIEYVKYHDLDVSTFETTGAYFR